MNKIPLYLVFCLISFSGVAQVGINTNNSDPHASAMLDVKSTTKGMLVPRMSSAQRNAISNPAKGLLVFDNNKSSFWFYNGTAWEDLSEPITADHIADNDDDTKIQVEKNNDEDAIRFDIAGTEYWKMKENRLETVNTGNSIFLGQNAGLNDDLSDNKNIYIGRRAGNQKTTADDNVAIGDEAFKNGNTGTLNVAVGARTLQQSTGNSNTAVGANGLQNNASGSENVAIGYAAGFGSSGSSNVYIGYAAGAGATGDNKLYIENGSPGLPLIYGEFDNNLVDINGDLETR